MNIIALFLALSCPETKVINTSGLKWNSYDQEMLVYAKKRCAELFKDQPCTKLFKKYDFQAYSVICGVKE